MAVPSRRVPRTAALIVALAAASAVVTGPAAVAAPAAGPAAGLAAAVTAATAVTVGNPGTQTNLQYDYVSLQMTVGGGTPGYRWSAVNLPTGLTINASTGLISGVARGAGTRTVTVTATDATGATGSATFGWRVIRDACPRC
ncbi:putative Ig domain-containing protein [Streptomyces sp. NPDC086023]|uniref:putative Ig domain-containing protein n=1 Tax=Streptomyces sp. NPDC086023 TaxID=3365746 RepID=UPI0037D3436E